MGIVLDGRVKVRWWRDQGHQLQPGDIDDILAAKPKILVIGTGYVGNLHVPALTQRLSVSIKNSVLEHEKYRIDPI